MSDRYPAHDVSHALAKTKEDETWSLRFADFGGGGRLSVARRRDDAPFKLTRFVDGAILTPYRSARFLQRREERARW